MLFQSWTLLPYADQRGGNEALQKCTMRECSIMKFFEKGTALPTVLSVLVLQYVHYPRKIRKHQGGTVAQYYQSKKRHCFCRFGYCFWRHPDGECRYCLVGMKQRPRQHHSSDIVAVCPFTSPESVKCGLTGHLT
jgi:hypothetical protein